MSQKKNGMSVLVVIVFALVLLTACGKGEKMTVVSVKTTGPEVVVVVEDINGDRYKTSWGNTGPEAFPSLGDTMRVDLDAEYPYNEWMPIG